MVAHPVLRTVRVFVAAFSGQVEEIVGGVHQINHARISRLGVINIAVLVAVKRTDPLEFVDFHFELAVVVGQHPALDLLRRERHVEIKIEIRLERGKPFEPPAPYVAVDA